MSGLGIWFGLCLLTYVQAQTIKQILDSGIPELTMLKAYLENMKRDIYTKDFASNSGQRFTFFAPSNAAFEKLPKGQRDLYQSASLSARNDFEQLLTLQTTVHSDFIPSQREPLKLSMFTEQSQKISNVAGRVLFFCKKGSIYYANGARITKGDQVASNGVIHIVDTVLYTLAENEVIYDKLSGIRQQNTKVPQQRFTRFLDLLKAYENHPVSSSNAATCMKNVLTTTTVFAPTDEAFSNIDNIRLNQLKGNPTQLKKVIDSHVMCQDVYFTNMLQDEISRGQGIPALHGTIKPQIFMNKLYVSNGCAKARISPAASNMTMLNGVIQPIDTVLGYMYNTLFEEIVSRNDIRDFRSFVQGSQAMKTRLVYEGLPTLEVPENAKYTVFAPLDRPIQMDNEFEISQRDDLDNILLSHVIPGQMTLDQLTSSSLINTLGKKDQFSRESSQLRIEVELNEQGEQEYYASINNVRGHIIESDICVRNGIIHIVDTLLAVPSQSPMAFLREDERFSTFYREIQFMNNFLNDQSKTITIFAPTNRAFSEMRKTSVGNMLLGSDKRSALRRVMNRHIIVGREILFSEARLPMTDVDAEFDKISLRRVGSEYRVVYNSNKDQVEVIEPDNRVTNGVIHIIDEVMFIDDLNALEIVGGSNALKSSVLSLLAVLCLSSIL